MSRLRSSVVKKYKKAVDKSREALAYEITVYYRTGNKIVNNDAYWDPINKEVLDPNSPNVSGNIYLDEIATKTLLANTSWTGMSDKYKEYNIPAGTIDNTDLLLTCKLSDALIDPALVSGDTIFHRATKIDVNGKIVVPKTTPFPYGLAGELYSCAVICTLDNTRN